MKKEEEEEKKKTVEIKYSPHKFYGNQELIAFIELFLYFIYIYIYKLKCSIYCCYALVEPHQQPHHPFISNHFSLIFWLFCLLLILYPSVTFPLTFSPPFYLFISPLLFTLMSLFFYPFIFLLF